MASFFCLLHALTTVLGPISSPISEPNVLHLKTNVLSHKAESDVTKPQTQYISATVYRHWSSSAKHKNIPHLRLPHYKSPTALSDMHHLTCGIGISSLLHSVNLILFTLLPVHFILRISPHHSHHLRSHHLSLRQSFTPDLKLISFTNPFRHNH